MAAGDAGTMLPIDAIDEFKTNQNPRAEYGWKPGAVVNACTARHSNLREVHKPATSRCSSGDGA
jgi:hypothetical protein